MLAVSDSSSTNGNNNNNVDSDLLALVLDVSH